MESYPGQSVLILIPAYRAAEPLAELIPRLQEKWASQILVIDDGSDDRTASVVRGLGEHCIVHPRNQGKGAALWTGVTYAKTMDVDWVVCMDADGQHQVEDVEALLAHRGESLFLIGNRMEDAGAMPWLRRWVNRGMSAWINRRLSTSVPDTQCGLRVYHTSILPDFEPQFLRFAFETEELFRLHRMGLPLKSVSISCRYAEGESHIRATRDTFKFLQLMSRRVRNSSLPVCRDVRPIEGR